MSLQLNSLSGCCAIQEIKYLNRHKDAEEAMAEFCKRLWTVQTWEYGIGYTYRPLKSRKVDAQYIFTGVEGFTRGAGNGVKIKYGSAFAAFINKNGLGKVVGTKAAPNRYNHPTHKVAAWIWTPAPNKLKKWYAKYEKEHPTS